MENDILALCTKIKDKITGGRSFIYRYDFFNNLYVIKAIAKKNAEDDPRL